MNQTDSLNVTQTELAYILILQNQFIIVESQAISLAALLQLLLLGILVWIKKTRDATQPAFTLVNCVLVLILLSYGGEIWSYYEYWINSDPEIEVTTYGLYLFFSKSLMFLLMYYSWLRGRPVIAMVAPRSVAFFHGLLALYAASLTVNLVLSALTDSTPEIITANKTITTINSILLCIFDFLSVLAFTIHLSTYKTRNNDPDKEKLKAISIYGFISTTWLLFWFSVSLVQEFTNWNVMTVEVQRKYLILFALEIAIPLIYILIQLLIKASALRKRRETVSYKIHQYSDNGETGT
ncbi:hypothetical protein BC830DRAFT_1085897 [Chytriomyces sp. MP71]|nr:hypothetical protein BC830DRAFT_1085897 [Chytriomyces sp. MP71]